MTYVRNRFYDIQEHSVVQGEAILLGSLTDHQNRYTPFSRQSSEASLPTD